MKGEIIRRMSMEIINEEGGDNPFRRDKEKDKTEDEDDYLVKTIGTFGLWQAVVCLTVSLTRVIAAWNMMSLAFLTPAVGFVCDEFSDNGPAEVSDSTCYNNCVNYEYSSVIGRSIVEDFGLICQNAWQASFVHSVLMMGIMVGAVLFGWISDRFGRRIAMLLSTVLNAVFMVALPFSPSYIIFICIRFMTGVATSGALIICIVQIMEIIGKRHREIAGVCILIVKCSAQASLAAFSYFTSNWQGYTLSYGVATCLILILILFVPESPRWLIANGKVDEVVKVVTSAADRNKFSTYNIRVEITNALEEMKLKDCEIVKTSYLDFFKTKTLFIPALMTFIIWLTLSMCYYGVNQHLIIAGLDPYLTVVTIGLIQIPFFSVGVILNKRFGRQISAIVVSICIALALLCIIFVPKDHWIGTVLGIVVLISSHTGFSISFVHVSEIFPTPVRSMSYGLALCGANIGAIAAPFIDKLLPKWLPSLIFCVSGLVAGLCCFALPETKGQNLKDTIEK